MMIITVTFRGYKDGYFPQDLIEIMEITKLMCENANMVKTVAAGCVLKGRFRSASQQWVRKLFYEISD